MRTSTWRTSRRGVLPRQFWLLIAGTFVYLVGYDLCYPFETIYLNSRLGISMTTVGLILGLSLLAGLPLQIVGGTLADHVGRRTVLIVGICASIALFEGLALARNTFEVIVAVAVEAAFGWAMFSTANNAMMADLVSPLHRVEAFSLSRVAVSAGAAVGPLTGSLLLASGLSYRWLFASGGGICFIFLFVAIFRLRETKPSLVRERTAQLSARDGYRRVLQDRRFITFCVIALVPLYCSGQFQVTLPVLLRSVHGMSATTWGLLVALYASCGALFQYPIVRRVKGYDKMILMSVSSALIALGLGGAAFAPVGWLTAALVLLISLGVILLIPISSTIVSEMAPIHLRGRYMGVWTLFWTGGVALGQMFGGIALGQLGGHGAYALLLAVGLTGSALFALFRRRLAVVGTARSPSALASDENGTWVAVDDGVPYKSVSPEHRVE